MFWYDRDPSGWGWFAMSGGMILFWALIITFGVLLFRAVSRPSGTHPSAGAPPGAAPPTGAAGGAEQLLAERFARGEIDEDEYQRRLAVLRGRTGEGPQLTKH